MLEIGFKMSHTTSDPSPLSIGPFQVIKKLGEGGMGEVFLVYDPFLLRSLVLKRMKAKVQGEEEGRKKFILEAQCMASLSHHSILPLYSFGEDESFPY